MRCFKAWKTGAIEAMKSSKNVRNSGGGNWRRFEVQRSFYIRVRNYVGGVDDGDEMATEVDAMTPR